MTVEGLSARDLAIRERWPAWSQPIVGTRPIGRGRSASATRNSARVRTTRIAVAALESVIAGKGTDASTNPLGDAGASSTRGLSPVVRRGAAYGGRGRATPLAR